MSKDYKDYQVAFDTNIFIDMFGINGYKKIFNKIEELKKQNRFFVTETVKKELEVHIDNQKTFDERISRVLPKFSDLEGNDKQNILNLKHIEKDFIKHINKKDDLTMDKIKKFIEDKSKELEKKLIKNKEEIIKNIKNIITDFDEKSSLSYDDKIFAKNEYDFRVHEGLSTPGSKDNQKDKYYNDFFIFKENINYSINNSCNLLFVTGDMKENKACKYYDADILEYFKEKTKNEYKVLDFESFTKEFNINIDDDDIEIIRENEVVRDTVNIIDFSKAFFNSCNMDTNINITMNYAPLGYDRGFDCLIITDQYNYFVRLATTYTKGLFKKPEFEILKEKNSKYCVIPYSEYINWKTSGKSILDLIEECVVE